MSGLINGTAIITLCRKQSTTSCNTTEAGTLIDSPYSPHRPPLPPPPLSLWTFAILSSFTTVVDGSLVHQS